MAIINDGTFVYTYLEKKMLSSFLNIWNLNFFPVVLIHSLLFYLVNEERKRVKQVFFLSFLPVHTCNERNILHSVPIYPRSPFTPYSWWSFQASFLDTSHHMLCDTIPVSQKNFHSANPLLSAIHSCPRINFMLLFKKNAAMKVQVTMRGRRIVSRMTRSNEWKNSDQWEESGVLLTWNPLVTSQQCDVHPIDHSAIMVINQS